MEKQWLVYRYDPRNSEDGSIKYYGPYNQDEVDLIEKHDVRVNLDKQLKWTEREFTVHELKLMFFDESSFNKDVAEENNRYLNMISRKVKHYYLADLANGSFAGIFDCKKDFYKWIIENINDGMIDDKQVEAIELVKSVRILSQKERNVKK